jgi:hypothetical protein
LVDTTLSLVNDIRLASGYVSLLQRNSDTMLDECLYTKNMTLLSSGNGAAAGRVDGDNGGVSGVSELGRKCNISGMTWNEDAAWKLALEGPTRVCQLLLGHVDFDSTTAASSTALLPIPPTISRLSMLQQKQPMEEEQGVLSTLIVLVGAVILMMRMV